MATNWIKYAIYLGIAWLVPLVVIVTFYELIFGSWFDDDPWAVTRDLNVIRGKRIEYQVSNLGYQNKPVVYNRDEYGLRGTCASNNTADIVTLGGSTTDQKYISDGDTWQDVLQQELRGLENLETICVANAGMDGHSTFGHIESFRRWFPLIEDFRPKFFLLYVGINDAAYRLAPVRKHDYRVKGLGIRNAWRDNSALYRHYKIAKSKLHMARQAYGGHRFEEKQPDEYLARQVTPETDLLMTSNIEGFRERLITLVSQIKNTGALPICVSQPHALAWDFGQGLVGIGQAFTHDGQTYNGIDYQRSMDGINKEMKEICIKNDGFYIDMASADFELTDYYDYIHMKPVGLAKVGSRLATEFRKQGITTLLSYEK